MPVYALNWPMVRLIVWLKRLTKATEAANEQRARIALSLERLAGPVLPVHEPRKIELGVATVEEWNKNHRAEITGEPV